MSIRTTVSSGIDVSNVGSLSLGVTSHENAGATAESAPVLLSVAADQIVSASDFARLVADGTPDLTAAFVARILNAVGEAIADIVDTASAAPNIDLGWGKFLFEIGGSVATATGTPTAENVCRFTGSVNSAIQRKFATMSAYVDTAANPCDLKRIRDKATSALNTISGTSTFYADGRGFTWGSANDKQALYTPLGTKVTDLTLDTSDSYANSLSLKVPATAAVPVGDYVVRIECAIGGKVYRMEKPVTQVTAVTPPAPIAQTPDGKAKVLTFKDGDSATLFTLGNDWAGGTTGVYPADHSVTGDWYVKAGSTVWYAEGEDEVAATVTPVAGGTSMTVKVDPESASITPDTYPNAKVKVKLGKVGGSDEYTLILPMAELVVE